MLNEFDGNSTCTGSTMQDHNKKYGGIPPFKTQSYVAKIISEIYEK